MGTNYYSTMQRKPNQLQRPRKQSRPVDDAFDLWLRRGLHQLYDDVTRERIPDELLKLIQEDREK